MSETATPTVDWKSPDSVNGKSLGLPIPAILAMVAITGIDSGLKTGQLLLSFVAFVGAGVYLATGSALATVVALFACNTFGLLFFLFRRNGQVAVARGLINRFGPARFLAAKPLLDEADKLVKEV